MAFPSLLVWFSLAHVCLGSIFTAPEQVTSKKYDFVVVGAGTAGSVIAARLSEDPSVRVLVIEAGVSDNGTDWSTISVPLLAGTGIGTAFDWNYTTTTQPGFNGPRRWIPPRFRHGWKQLYHEEFDRIATCLRRFWLVLEQSSGIYLQGAHCPAPNEKHTAPWNNRSNVGEFNPLVHGFGPLLTGLTPTLFESDRRVIQTTSDHPHKYPFNLDLNSGDGLGFGFLHTTVGDGARSTSSSAYLHPALNSRSNLDLLLHTQVIRLTSTLGDGTFDRVHVSQSASATKYSFKATKEVIVSAGTVGTPQLLMLSGIGPAKQLRHVGIAPVLDLPDVGANLQDQTILALQYQVNGTTLSSFLRDEAAVGAALAQWATNKTGPAAGNTVVNTIGYLRLPDNSTLLNLGDPAAGPHSPHFQLAFLNTFYANPGQVAPTTGEWMSVTVVVQSPTSRGSLKITSSSPFDHPTIDPAYFTTAFDIGTAIKAIKTLRNFLSTSAWDGFIIAPFPEVAGLTTNAEIEAYVRTFSDTIKHPTSTATISKTTDTGGVVGPDLRVKGAAGLRIVDASILPASVAGFPQAEVYIIAERAADLIKSTWSLG
ncbi:aryl-alcohol-oxidase from pleurotus Eryingii [Mycena vulgaris]|nr:aryl-alcohol-oxidase from pleurotus Eryingii [Mycena vulgaris]